MSAFKMPRKILSEIYEEESNDYDLVETKFMCDGRWVDYYEMIFKDKEENFFLTQYSVGKTESVYCYPFDSSHDDEIEVVEVIPVEKNITVIEYEEK